VKLEIAHARVTATREAVSPSHNLITRSSRALYPNRLPLSDDNAHAFVCATLLYAQHMPTSQHHDFWFTTSGTETFLTSGTETFITSGGSTILYTPTPTDSKGPTGLSYTSFTPSSTDSVPSYPSPPPSRVPSTSLSRSSDPVMTSATPSSTPAFNAVEAGPGRWDRCLCWRHFGGPSHSHRDWPYHLGELVLADSWSSLKEMNLALVCNSPPSISADLRRARMVCTARVSIYPFLVSDIL
jgi:hypothetical protein